MTFALEGLLAPSLPDPRERLLEHPDHLVARALGVLE
jgi:hypothetical protein